jgi:hypothetical protein
MSGVAFSMALPPATFPFLASRFDLAPNEGPVHSCTLTYTGMYMIWIGTPPGEASAPL